jgi:hypothetical protein
MSINMHIVAKWKLPSGAEVEEDLDLAQTPTEVTKRLIELPQEQIFSAYEAWVASQCNSVPFQFGLLAWISRHKEEGHKVVWEAW